MSDKTKKLKYKYSAVNTHKAPLTGNELSTIYGDMKLISVTYNPHSELYTHFFRKKGQGHNKDAL